jgi:hypothetical protein
MPTLDFSPIVLEQNVNMGPATVVLEDLAVTGSLLREQTTTAWKKNWTEQSYEFPNTYVNLPLRTLSFDPISSYADDQNARFAQRYAKK